MYTYTHLCISDLFIKYKKYEFCRPREKFGIMYIKNLEIIPLVEKHQGKFHLLLLFTMGNFYFWRHFNVCVCGGGGSFSSNNNNKKIPPILYLKIR